MTEKLTDEQIELLIKENDSLREGLRLIETQQSLHNSIVDSLQEKLANINQEHGKQLYDLGKCHQKEMEKVHKKNNQFQVRIYNYTKMMKEAGIWPKKKNKSTKNTGGTEQ